MPQIIFEAGAILVMAKYIEQKNPNGVWYFRRRAPHDVQKHYPKIGLSPIVATALIACAGDIFFV